MKKRDESESVHTTTCSINNIRISCGFTTSIHICCTSSSGTGNTTTMFLCRFYSSTGTGSRWCYLMIFLLSYLLILQAALVVTAFVPLLPTTTTTKTLINVSLRRHILDKDELSYTLNYRTRNNRKLLLKQQQNHKKQQQLLFMVNSFDNNNNNDAKTNTNTNVRTYGRQAESPILDMIDLEGAMNNFFTTREEWHPIFYELAGSKLPKDTISFLTTIIDTGSTSSALTSTSSIDNFWKTNIKNNPIPTNDDDKSTISNFLESMHQSLLEIPVNEISSIETYDTFDEHFVEEGRRLLALNRFIVHRSSTTSTSSTAATTSQSQTSIERYDELFTTCWKEIIELYSTNQDNTGSVVLVVPSSTSTSTSTSTPQSTTTTTIDDLSINDIRRFVDMNLIRPIQWLGLQDLLEIVSFQRGTSTPVIRLLYKLNTVPATDTDTDTEIDTNTQ